MSEGAEIWLVRHARTSANASGIWQGRTEGEIDQVGEQQMAALAARFAGRHFDLVLTSPLQRAQRTAAIFGTPTVEEDLIEIDLGRWDGLSTSELVKGHSLHLEAFGLGEEVALGTTGETPTQISTRIESIIERVFDRLGPGERAVVVTHGGLLDSVTQRFFGRDHLRRRLGDLTENTGITRLKRWHGRTRLTSFNDTGHLGPRPGAVEAALLEGHTALTLIRHGQTRANVERRWQGQSDWGLDELGRRQAQALAAWYGAPDRVVSSPLGRALETARTLAPEPEIVEGLVELGFGTWEGMTVEEVQAADSHLYSQIFHERQDLPRGSTGESWGQMAQRIRGAIESIAPVRGQLTAVVTHGAAIRAYLADLAARGWSAAGDWDTPTNTSVTHLVLEDRGPRIVDFSSAIHLETIELQMPPESSLEDRGGVPIKTSEVPAKDVG